MPVDSSRVISTSKLRMVRRWQMCSLRSCTDWVWVISRALATALEKLGYEACGSRSGGSSNVCRSTSGGYSRGGCSHARQPRVGPYTAETGSRRQCRSGGRNDGTALGGVERRYRNGAAALERRRKCGRND